MPDAGDSLGARRAATEIAGVLSVTGPGAMLAHIKLRLVRCNGDAVTIQQLNPAAAVLSSSSSPSHIAGMASYAAADGGSSLQRIVHCFFGAQDGNAYTVVIESGDDEQRRRSDTMDISMASDGRRCRQHHHVQRHRRRRRHCREGGGDDDDDAHAGAPSSRPARQCRFADMQLVVSLSDLRPSPLRASRDDRLVVTSAACTGDGCLWKVGTFAFEPRRRLHWEELAFATYRDIWAMLAERYIAPKPPMPGGGDAKQQRPRRQQSPTHHRQQEQQQQQQQRQQEEQREPAFNIDIDADDNDTRPDEHDAFASSRGAKTMRTMLAPLSAGKGSFDSLNQFWHALDVPPSLRADTLPVEWTMDAETGAPDSLTMLLPGGNDNGKDAAGSGGGGADDRHTHHASARVRGKT